MSLALDGFHRRSGLMLLVVQYGVVDEARNLRRLLVDVEQPKVDSSYDDTEGDE